MNLLIHGRRLGVLVAAVISLSLAQAANAANWDPIDPADLKSTASALEPDAQAEVLFTRSAFSGDSSGSYLENYSRTKVYKQKNADDLGWVRIEVDKENGKIWNLAARVTKPDGTSTEYGKDAFKEVVSVKTEYGKGKSYTFAAPGIQAGDVVELRWVEPANTWHGWYYTRDVQQRIPIRKYIMEVAGADVGAELIYFNLPGAEVRRIDNARAQLVCSNIPSYKPEPHAPPVKDNAGWLVIWFKGRYMHQHYTGEKLWESVSSAHHEDFKVLTRPGSAIKRKATELLTGASSDEDKINRLHEFTRTQIANTDYDTSPKSEHARKRMEQSGITWGPEDSLSNGCGSPQQINELFASLCRAAGFEVLRTLSSSRNLTTKVRHNNGYIFLRSQDNLVSVKLGEKWKNYSPGAAFLPSGMVPSHAEFADALLCNDEKPSFSLTPPAPASASQELRKGRFKLLEDGTLEGTVEVTYTGHFAGSMKAEWAKTVREEVDKAHKTSIQERVPAAEIDSFEWENLTGPALPLINRYHVRIPGYAESVGDKLVFAADYFTLGGQAIFTDETRTLPIYLRHAWSEIDDIEITLPEGYVFDQPTNPKSVTGPNGLLAAKYKLSYKAKQNLFTFRREFSFGADGVISFQQAAYPTLKGLCDAVHASDKHTLVIAPKAPAATAK